jgi:hypothetical protein
MGNTLRFTRGACLPAFWARDHIPLLLHQTQTCKCVSHAQTRPKTPMAWGNQVRMRPPDKRGPLFYWLASVMRDTVIQHHHGQHSIGTLEPRIADLRNAAAGMVYTLLFVRFRQVFDSVPFPMRRREGRRWANCWRLYRPKNQLSR